MVRSAAPFLRSRQRDRFLTWWMHLRKPLSAQALKPWRAVRSLQTELWLPSRAPEGFRNYTTGLARLEIINARRAISAARVIGSLPFSTGLKMLSINFDEAPRAARASEI